MKTQFRKATPDDAQKVWHIVWHTKNAIYPDYYTRAVVEYIDRYYTFDIIKIVNIALIKITYLCREAEHRE